LRRLLRGHHGCIRRIWNVATQSGDSDVTGGARVVVDDGSTEQWHCDSVEAGDSR